MQRKWPMCLSILLVLKDENTSSQDKPLVGFRDFLTKKMKSTFGFMKF